MSARKEAGKLRGYSNQVLRDVECKLPRPSGKIKEWLSDATRILIRENNDKRRPCAGCRRHSYTNRNEKYKLDSKVALAPTSQARSFSTAVWLAFEARLSSCETEGLIQSAFGLPILISSLRSRSAPIDKNITMQLTPLIANALSSYWNERAESLNNSILV
jgi:hypothetical protein